MRIEAEEEIHPVDRYVGRRVCEKRLALGYNQTDLGQAIGLSFQQVQKYEKGRNRISASRLWDIAGFLKVDISYFFDGLAGAFLAVSSPYETARPVTSTSLEIGILAPKLSVRQQRAVLEMFRAMVEKT